MRRITRVHLMRLFCKFPAQQFSTREIADHFNSCWDGTIHTLNSMRQMGAIEQTKAGNGKRWFLKNRNIDVSSMAGTHPNTLATLREYGLRRRTHGRAKRQDAMNPDWRGATELERCWSGWTKQVDNG